MRVRLKPVSRMNERGAEPLTCTGTTINVPYSSNGTEIALGISSGLPDMQLPAGASKKSRRTRMVSRMIFVYLRFCTLAKMPDRLRQPAGQKEKLYWFGQILVVQRVPPDRVGAV